MPMFTWRAEGRQTSAFFNSITEKQIPLYRLCSINNKTKQWLVWVRYFNFRTRITKRAGATKAQMAPLVSDSQQLQKWGQKFSTTHSMKHKCKMTGREVLFFFLNTECSRLLQFSPRLKSFLCNRCPQALMQSRAGGSLTCLLHHNCPEMTSWTPRISAVGTLRKMFTCYTSTKRFMLWWRGWHSMGLCGLCEK